MDQKVLYTQKDIVPPTFPVAGFDGFPGTMGELSAIEDATEPFGGGQFRSLAPVSRQWRARIEELWKWECETV
jgi:hypothetical protein